MEIKPKAALDFTDYLVPKKGTFGFNVCSCLAAENKTFTNLPYPTSTLFETTTSLSNADQVALSGDKVAIEKRNELNLLWNKQFRQTAAYVSLVADGNITLIRSAGFAPTKTTRQRKPKITGLANFKANVETPKGTATVSCDRAKGASGYVVVAATEGVKMSMNGDDIIFELNGAQVRIKTITQCNAELTGLPSEQRISLSMFAFNASGTSPMTDAQSILPQ